MAQAPVNLKFENEWGYADAIVVGDTIYFFRTV
jgi:hypothetical protein